MTKGEFKSVVYRVNVLGFVIAVPFFLGLVTLGLLLLFEFDWRMMAWYVLAVSISCVILLPPTFVYLYTGFKRVSETFDAAARVIAGEAEASSVSLRRLETYPVKMAWVAVLVGTVGGTVGTIFYYCFAEYSAVLCLYYQVMIVTFAFTTAYLEYHILYRFLEPLRKEVYTPMGLERVSGGISLKTRILFMAGVFILVPLMFGWLTAVTRTSLYVRDQAVDGCESNTAVLADDIAVEAVSGDFTGVEARLEAFSASPESSFTVLGPQGEPVAGFDLGGTMDQETEEELLSELEESGGKGTYNSRMTWAVAGAPIGGTGYTLVQMVPIDMLRGEVWTIGFIFALIAVIVVLVGIFLTWLTYHSIAGPIVELGEVAAKVSEGNLTLHPSVASSDETGRLSEAFGHMVDNLRQVTMETVEAAGHASEGASGVSATAEEVQASLEQLTSIIMQLARNAETEAETAEKVNELTVEIMAALQLSSDQAEDGVELSQTSSQLAEAGRNDALNAVDRMSSARDSILGTARIIGDLDERSGEIGVIIEIIDNIADQTNLLALNAAIEAARAQEHGRGFSVVADEVRKLAEESSASTNRIAGLVREIQKLANEAVGSTQRGTEEVAQGMEAVQVAGESLQKIYDFVRRSGELSRTISETARRHLELGGKVMEAVREIHSIADGNASSSEEISASAEEQAASMQELTSTSMELVALSERLRKLVERFRI